MSNSENVQDAQVEWGLDDYDREVEKLLKGKAALKERLQNPDEKTNRASRRVHIIGRYGVETMGWTQAHMNAVRKFAGEAEAWLFDPVYLEPDGWTCTGEDGKWVGPR